MTIALPEAGIHLDRDHPFNRPAPAIDNGAGQADPARYHDPAYARVEWDRVFARSWLLAGASSDIPEAGDFLKFDIGPESFVVARGEDGVARAHYNVCPHRGSQLVASDFGSVDRFTCPFHSWRFGLDGRCQSVTDADSFDPRVLAHGTHLSGVRCEEAAGLVFIAMDPAIQPLCAFLGPILAQLDLYRIGEMRAIQHRQSDWASNWKCAVDAFAEIYHLHAVHPQTQGLMDDRTQIDLWPGGLSRQFVPFAQPSPRYPDQHSVNPGIQMMLRDAGIDPAVYVGDAQETRGAVQAAKRRRSDALGLGYERFSDSQLSDSVVYSIFPNVQIGCHPEAVFLHRFLPHASDPDRFAYDTCILYRHVDAPGYAPPAWMGLSAEVDVTGRFRPEITRTGLGEPPGLGEVLDQDSDLLPIVQKGMHSRGFRGPLWSRQEDRLRHFHAEIDRMMAG